MVSRRAGRTFSDLACRDRPNLLYGHGNGVMLVHSATAPGGQSREETAREVFTRTGNPDAIAAALRAAELIEP
jgi:hypothetical protein